MGPLLFFIIFIVVGSKGTSFTQDQIIPVLVGISVAEAVMWNWIWMREIKERYKEK